MRLFLASNIGGIKKENGKKVPVSFFGVEMREMGTMGTTGTDLNLPLPSP